MEAFVDPLAAIRPDSGHSSGEQRWLMLGMLRDQTLAVIVHAYEESGDLAHVRIISARNATRRERLEYETGVYSVRDEALGGGYNMSEPDEDGMCAEYDFSNAVRGKYYRPNMRITFPIYLDDDVLAHFRPVAQARGVQTCELVNEILRRQMPDPGESAHVE